MVSPSDTLREGKKMSHHDRAKHFPQLLPGPRSSTPQPSTVVVRPKKSSTACLACKHAKRKCSGSPGPCNACEGTNQPCVFDPTRDQRRKVGLKRAIAELKDYKELLESLLKTLRSQSHQDIERVVGKIQNSAPLNDIALAVGCTVTRFPDDQKFADVYSLAVSEEAEEHLEPNQGQAGSTSRRFSGSTPVEDSLKVEEAQNVECTQRPALGSYARLTLERICDMPLRQVPAKPWTKVTDDDDMVSHLVSLYFTWDHPCVQIVDQDNFLQHMESGQSSELCTPLLVNSLLAMASVYSDLPDMSIPDDAFLSEADRLWKAEEGRPTLANVQALLLMCCVSKFQDKPSLSWLMLRQAVQLAQDMGLFQNPCDSGLSPEMTRVRATTAWGIFNLNMQTAMELQKVPNLDKPVFPVWFVGDNDVPWTPYPRLHQKTLVKQQAELPAVRQGLGILTNIMMKNQELFCRQGAGINTDELTAQAEKTLRLDLEPLLSEWSHRSQREDHPVPQVLILIMKCYQAIMTVCQTVIERTQREPQPHPQLHWFLDVKAKSALQMAQTLFKQRQSYGLRHIPSQMVDATQTGLVALVHRLEDSDENRMAFVELCRFGTILSERFRSMATTVSHIRSMAQSREIVLPPEAVAILKDPDPEEGDDP